MHIFKQEIAILWPFETFFLIKLAIIVFLTSGIITLLVEIIAKNLIKFRTEKKISFKIHSLSYP